MTIRHIIPALLLVLPCSLQAQDLHKEITVEQEIVPTKRDASRIMVHPPVTLPPLKASGLTFSDRTVTTAVPRSITVLDPVAWGDRLYSSPYRGYVDLAAGMPLFDAAVSAGYRILDDDRTRLSLWGQYDGAVYNRGRDLDGGRMKWQDHTASVGLDLHRAVGNRSFVDAGVDYTYATHKLAGRYSSYTNPAGRLNAAVNFRSSAAGLDYSVALKYRRFAFGKAKNLSVLDSYVPVTDKTELPNVSENLFGAVLTGAVSTGDNSCAGLDVDASLLRTSSHYGFVPPIGMSDYELISAKTMGLMTLTPYWMTRSDKVTFRVGADVDVAVKSGNAVRFSPDVTFAWSPTQVFGLELKAHGGSRFNTLSGLYDITPYLTGVAAYTELSRIPYAFDGKLTMGPFLGSFIELFGGYAKADGWLMGAAGSFYPGGGVLYGVDLKGWHFGVAAGYDNGKRFAIRASWETAPSEYNKAYYEWRDRAKHVVKANLKLRPVDRLLIEAVYEFRGGRCEYAFNPEAVNVLGLPYHEPVRQSLRAVSDLSVGVGYEVSDRLTLFARGENLMNRSWLYLGDRPVQGTHVLIGAGFKF